VNVIAGSYRMTSQLPTYWYGYWGDVTTNYWSQIDHDITRLTGIDNNTAVSISWQNVGIGVRSSPSISFLIRSGNHYVDKPILRIHGEPDAVPVGSSIGIHVFIWDSIPTSLMNIYTIIAGDILNITLVASDHLPNVDEIGGSLTTGFVCYSYCIYDRYSWEISSCDCVSSCFIMVVRFLSVLVRSRPDLWWTA
jgi:hypothetical protein